MTTYQRARRKKQTTVRSNSGCSRQLRLERLEDRRLLALDYGDAPSPYSTLSGENGARHADDWMQIGASIVGESASQKSARSVSMSSDGTRLAVGSYENDDAHTNSGHVRIYEKRDGDWVQLGSDIDGQQTEERFGFSVSLSGDGSTVVVGSSHNSGKVRVYRFGVSTWEQLGLDINGKSTNDMSGYAVSINHDGSIIAIGAPNSHSGGDFSGNARVFQYLNSSWQQLGSDIEGVTNSFLGRSLALTATGTRLAVGAPFVGEGYVRAYDFDGSNWSPVGSEIVGESDGDVFGRSVSMNAEGNVIAVGADYNEGNGTQAGHVRVFELVEGAWIQIGADLDGEQSYHQFGFSVDLDSSGETLAVGAPHTSTAGEDNPGSMTLYKRFGDTWVQVGERLTGNLNGEAFGWSVSLDASGTNVVAGVPRAPNPSSGGTEWGTANVYAIGTASLRLGQKKSLELVGNVSQNADGDGDSDDGVIFGELKVGQTNASVLVNVQNAPNGAKLDAWIDFNQDGSWDGNNERICVSMPVLNGSNLIQFTIPSNVPAGVTYARLRLSTEGGLGVRGLAADGEVEDYQITLLDPVRRDVAWSVSDQAFHPSSTDYGVTDLELIDLDGDGDLDLLDAKDYPPYAPPLRWYENDGLVFSTAHDIGTTYPSNRFEVVDIEGDGDLDVIGINVSGFILYINDGMSVFGNISWVQQNNFIPITPGFREVKVGDIDGDGDYDFVAQAGTVEGGKLYLYEQTAPLVFSAHIIPTIQKAEHWDHASLEILDFDSDGDLDIVTASSRSLSISWHENNNLSFQEHSIPINDNHRGVQEIIDFDRDGDFDILFLSQITSNSETEQKLLLYENEGNSDFSERLIFSRVVDNNRLQAFASGDFDGDGSVEIFLSSIIGEVLYLRDTNSTSNEAELILNVRDITPTPNLRVAEILPADFDGDGDMDVLLGTAYGGSDSRAPLIWLLNTSRPNIGNLQNAAFDVNSLSQTINLDGINSGLGESQTLRVSSTINNDSLATTAISYQAPDQTGSLTISPQPGEIGSATVSVIVEDGGQDNDLSTMKDNVTHIEEFQIGVGLSSFEFGEPHNLQLRGNQQHVTVTNHEFDGTNDRVTFTLDENEWFGINPGDEIPNSMSGHLTPTLHFPKTMVPGAIRLLTNADDVVTFDQPDRWQLLPRSANEYPHDHILMSVPRGDDQVVMVHGQSPWRNVLRNHDVNNNGETTSLDALQIINELSRGAYTNSVTGYLKNPEELSEWPGLYYDPNGDDRATALDALLVINQLARNSVSGEGEAVTADYLSQGVARLLSQGMEVNDEKFESEFEETDFIYSDSDPETSLASDRPEDLVYATVGQESTASVDSLLSDLENWGSFKL